MKIKFLYKHAGNEQGDIVELEPSEALQFVEAGAVEVIEEVVEVIPEPVVPQEVRHKPKRR